MRNNAAYLAACAAMVAAFAASPLAASELTHRWSFNGDWADLAGGADAAKCGTYVSLYGGRVHMGYGDCTHGTGYVDLGTNMLDTTAATIEIWARHDGVKNWSRIFDYGADDSHYFTLTWTYGTDPDKDRAGMKNPGELAVDDTMAPYEIGEDYYIAVTFTRSGDATVVNWQRRDARTGELQKSGSMNMPDGIQKIVDPVLYLGHSQYTTDRDAQAAYDEVRIWSGVLSDDQLAASAAAGPDATIAADAGEPQFTPAPAPEPPEQKAALPNGGFRLMTYNVQYCYDEVDTVVPERTAARIVAENPDFCCVNEIRDSNAYPQATLLAKFTGLNKYHVGSGTQGNAVLSKETPIKTEGFRLPSAAYSRYLGICEFSNVVIAVAHLDTGGTDSAASNTVALAVIREKLAAYAETKPVFLCGDWNTRPNSDNMAVANEFLEILSPTNGVRTYHGHKATGGSILDYISVDKAHRDDIYVQSASVVEDIVTSDHNPVIVEFYRRPAASDLGWVDESFLSTGRTGTWASPVVWNGSTWKAELGGDNVFTPATSSGGNVVTLTATVAFGAVPVAEATPGATAQGAVWLGTNGNFQVWTRTGGAQSSATAGWLDVAAEGVTPQAGVDYTFRLVFDYAAKTYSVEVKTGSTGFTRLREINPVNPVQDFPLAASGTAISKVRFSGDGVLTSILGEYVVAEGFAADDEVLLKDNASVILDAAQAAWLNSCTGGKTAVGNAAAGLSAADFDRAYLLNLDIAGENSYAFEITGITVGAENVTVAVTLTRTGKIAPKINGSLRFYGAATLEAFANPALQPLSSEPISDADFSAGDTATATYPKFSGSTTNTFFKARIEDR